MLHQSVWKSLKKSHFQLKINWVFVPKNQHQNLQFGEKKIQIRRHFWWFSNTVRITMIYSTVCLKYSNLPLDWVTTPLRLLAPLIWYWPKDNRTSSLYALIQSKPILLHNLAHKMATHWKAHKLSFRELCEWQPYKHWCSCHWHYL